LRTIWFFFVDDINFSELITCLEEGLEFINKWCNDNGVYINFSKSNFMIIGKESTEKYDSLTELFCKNETDKVSRVF